MMSFLLALTAFVASLAPLPGAAPAPDQAIVIQGIWAAFYVLPRTVKADGTYGNLYGDLLTYVISAALIFYILAITAVFVLRVKQPDAERPYKAFGYPIVPALYVIGASVILVVLFIYQTTATWPGLLIVLTGVPVYFIWRGRYAAHDEAA